MTQDDILRMAEEADALADKEIAMPGEYHPDWHEVRDRHFAALVAAAEREECAKVCDEAAGMLLSHRDRAGAEIAVALRDSVRARGKT